MFLSNGAYTGTNVPAGQKALDWVNANRDFVSGHPMASAYLVPQTTDFSQEAYNQELAVGLRVRRTPGEFVDQIYAASTNAKFYPALAEKNAMIAEDPSRKTELNTAFRAFTLQLAAQNPTWDKVLNDPTRKATAHDALLELNTSLAPGGGAPDSPQAAGIRGLITDYQSFAQQEVQMKNAGESTQGLTQSWHDYLTNLSKTNQILQPVVDGVFRKLPSYDIFSSNAQAA